MITKDNTLKCEDFNIQYCALNNITAKYHPPFSIIEYPNYFKKENIRNGKPCIYKIKILTSKTRILFDK
ncbi:hypothetical protein BGU66_05100 [Clostridioides difficile]|nr:hypothetical protein BGU66_05100 [Clostridioides difficile]